MDDMKLIKNKDLGSKMMKRQIYFCIFLSLIIGINALAEEAEYLSNQILVRFADVGGQAMTTSQKTKIMATTLSGAKIIRQYSLVSGLTLVQLPDGVDVPTGIAQLNSSPTVVYAEPCYISQLSVIPNDPNYPDQWNMDKIQAPDAWDTTTGSPGVIVAVVDTGIDYNHPDIRGNMWVNYAELNGTAGVDDDGNGYVDDIYGWDAAGPTLNTTYLQPDGDPCDSHFHGTHVAGIIGAVGNNLIGVAGVNWRVRLMAVKIFPDDASYTNTATEIAGIQYAIENGADIINASWGGYGYSQALYDIIAQARDRGILFVAAAGNEGNDNDSYPAYPASYNLDNIISVMATDNTDTAPYWSNYGATTVDLAAPGVDIFSTTPTYETLDMNDPNFTPEEQAKIDVNYAYLSGTSMAAPHVAGACALIWAYKPILPYQYVRKVIISSVDQIPSLNGECVSGGRLNLYKAIDATKTRVLNVQKSITYTRIQDAINGASNSNTLVADMNDMFFEAIDFNGKNVVLRSGDISHPNFATLYPETLITATGKNRHAVAFQNGETSSAAIKGFTIMDGYATGSNMADTFGGGIYCYNASPLISDCNIVNNSAQVDGGGIYCDEQSNPTIQNCIIRNNTASGQDGGGIYGWDASPTIKNCLIIDNTATRDGGGIYFNGSSSAGEPAISNCTIAGNAGSSYNGLGGGLYLYWSSKPVVKDCIFSSNDNYAVYEEDTDSDPVMSYCMFHSNPDGDYYDADTTAVYSGKAALNTILGLGNILDGDPLFVRGRLGSYYLSQLAADQIADSNVVNAGSTTAAAAGMSDYSTRTDKVNDSGQVDLGFHYNDQIKTISSYMLVTQVYQTNWGTLIPSPGVYSYKQYANVALTAIASNTTYRFKAWYGTDDDSKKDVILSNGVPMPIQYNIVTIDSDKYVIAEFETAKVNLVVTVSPDGNPGTYTLSPLPTDPRHGRNLYQRGEVVTITATPENYSNRAEWTGTDDDTSSSLVNTVTMSSDKQVIVKFYAPRTLIVGGGGEPGAYTDLGEAITDARDGDVIVVHEGEWYGAMAYHPFYIEGKAITIRSTNPDDPCVVAGTVLRNSVQFENVGRDTVLYGVTIRDYTYYNIVSGTGGSDPAATNAPFWSDCDGYNGSPIYGGGITIGEYSQSSVEFAELGVQPTIASPTIINCVIRNMQIWAGDGGNGVTGTACSELGDGGWGGKAYGGGVYIGPYCNPLFKNVTIRDCNAIGGDGGNPGCAGGSCGYPGSWGDPTGLVDGHTWFNGPYDDVWKYSGLGGGAYCDVNSAPEFIDCNFINNTAKGGSSGNDTSQGPTFPHSRIDSYGGAVYCAAASSPKFTNCRFIDNVIDANGSTPLWRWSPKLTPGENVAVTIWDKYFGFGGAVAGEGYTRSYEGVTVDIDGGQPFFENCTFENNTAPHGTGGAMHWMRGYGVINKSSFTNSSALHGGAIYIVNGTNKIVESIFTDNTATDLIGQGGAIAVFDANVLILDSNIVSNSSVYSGGGVFLSGSGYSVLKNDLIRDNTAGKDGGGVSANTYSDVNIINSTITGNNGGSLGGGLSVSYNSFAHVLDSIIFGNFAVDGPQIAIISGSTYYTQPSVVEVEYSDIGPGKSVTALTAQTETPGVVAGSAAQVIENQTIQNQLTSSGWAEVIVTLEEPAELKEATNWDSSTSVAALQTEIANRQQIILDTLTSQEYTIRHRCQNITTFSLLVSSSGFTKLVANPLVKFIEPVRYLQTMTKPALVLANGMGVRTAYSGSGVSVAIVDTGVDYRHPKLGNGGFPNTKIIGGYDTGANDADPLPVGEAHGTCCAGIAAGDVSSTTGDYVGGVAYNAKIYALKAAADNVNGFDEDAEIAAWDWCVTHKNDNAANPILVISNSFGSLVGYQTHAAADAARPASATMIATVVKAGITILASSGNEYTTNAIAAPAALSNVISVGAVYIPSDLVTEYSNTADILDILAPADPVYTTDIVGTAGYATGDYFSSFAGTSSALPFAAGSVAVLQSAAKQIFGFYLKPEQVKSILIASGDLIADTKAPITKPRINLGSMINSLLASPIYIQSGSSIEHNWWNPTTYQWSAASHNLDIDAVPLFEEGYFLSQIAAGQTDTSICVDKGHADVNTANLYKHTTRTDLVIEDLDSIVDLGYHYVRSSEFISDLNYDGRVNMTDYYLFLRHWLDQDCEFPDWCQGADLNRDGAVNFRDDAIIAADINDGLRETTPPEPNPMTWDVVPTSTGATLAANMTATKARDNYGGIIEYLFEKTIDGSSTSYIGWSTDRTLYDSGLTKGKTYGYRVKARDRSLNETDWSMIGYVTAGLMPPPAAPINLQAVAISQTQINLAWTDLSTDELGFKIERRTATNPYTQIVKVAANVTTFSDTGLTPATAYTYRVRAYNTDSNSAYSNEASATTQTPPPEPNTPVMIIGASDPNSNETAVTDPNTGKTYWYHRIVATVPDFGGATPVWFKFVCLTNSVFSSPWISDAATFPINLTHPVSSKYPMAIVSVNGTTVNYYIMVKEGGSFGYAMRWQVCASYSATGDSAACSASQRIPPD
jgi:parallel beta-helix repeat protein